ASSSSTGPISGGSCPKPPPPPLPPHLQAQRFQQAAQEKEAAEAPSAAAEGIGGSQKDLYSHPFWTAPCTSRTAPCKLPPTRLAASVLAQAYEPAPFSEDVTTLMIRHIPAHYTQELLLKEWPPVGQWDFFLLPYSMQRKRPTGYAFINFTKPQYAQRFYKKWHCSFLSQPGSSRCLDINAACVQGLGENVAHIRSCLRDKKIYEASLPIIFDGTKRLDIRLFFPDHVL
ncbi:unnamed protein product, partial [Polarella glacialis]